METGKKRKAAALSVGSNTFLVLSKLVVGVMTRSVAIISEAIHSAMDLLAAIIAYVAVSLSDRPPDQEHPHGHGKIESLSGAVEALLIFAAVLIIVYEAIEKLVHGGEVKQIYLGSVVMGVSAAVNTVVSWYLQRVGRRTDSEALLADAAHLRTDVYTSAGVLLGLLLVHFTRLQWLDPVTAVGVALLIVREAWLITRRSVGNLLDESLPPAEQQQVEQALQRTGVTYHALRSRKSGSERKVDLHLNVSPSASAEEIHELCDRIEHEVALSLPGAQVLIHPEPDLERDDGQGIRAAVEQILQQHSQMFLGYSDLHTSASQGHACVALRLRLAPSLSVAEADTVCRHLEDHIGERVPGSRVYIRPLGSEVGARLR